MHRRALNVAGYAAIALVAVLLWPQRWGGTMTYDITQGNSMQPSFQAGDLAILRKTGRYDVGDVAAYRSPTLRMTVMHRIKTKTAAGYTFQGDNNSFVDPDLVRGDQLLGKLVVRVPGVGRFLAWLVKPINLALAIGALILLLADRRDKRPAAAPPDRAVAAAGPPLVVRITALRLPQELPTAEVEHAEDLERLATMHGIAILRDATADYLMQGGMLYRHVRTEPAQAPTGRRRSTATGRDWAYDARSDAHVVLLSSRRASAN